MTGRSKKTEFYQVPLKDGRYSSNTTGRMRTIENTQSEHDKRCVFNNLLKNHHNHHHQLQQHEEIMLKGGLESEDPSDELAADPRKLYVAVQQGHDIPLKGLRKSAPKPNIYKGKA